MSTLLDREGTQTAFRSIARRIGMRLRNELSDPEGDALPSNHVDLLLQLRHKERAQARSRRG